MNEKTQTQFPLIIKLMMIVAILLFFINVWQLFEKYNNNQTYSNEIYSLISMALIIGILFLRGRNK
jgi:nitrogen fixation-related uncharacterized protein